LAQDTGTSPELINNTAGAWQGCYTQTSGAFWGGTSGGPCPGIGDGGSIIFSYGEVTLSQTQSVAAALEAAGTGLLITGYNYGWSVKNSNINGSQPGFFDPTAWITVTLRRADGTVAQSDVYNYGYWLPSWTRFSGTRTYDNPYSIADIGDITLSVTGRDHGFWAGYYGAEFAGFSLSVNYSVDPCVTDPLYAPSCSGYAQALLALLAPNADTVPEPEVMATPEPMTEIAVTESVLQPAAPTNQPPQPSTSESASGGGSAVSLGTILSVLRSEQNRIAAVERQAVEQSAETGQASIAAVEALAEYTTNQSSAASMDSSLQMSVTAVAESRDATAAHDVSANGTAALGSGVIPGLAGGTGLDTMTWEIIPPVSEMLINIQRFPDTDRDSAMMFSPESQPDAVTTLMVPTNQESAEGSAVLTAPAVSVAGFTATDLLGTQQTAQAETSPEPQMQNPRSQPTADMLGTQDMAALTQAPQGFDAYQVSMPDPAFYASRDIYPNQVVQDNPRGRRLFGGTDRVHSDMVQQQYRR